jgi:hypothetical protein
MAGNGPAPKQPAERRNKTAPKRGEWVDLVPLVGFVLPELPELAGGEEWSATTRAAWAAWREDPVTSQYSPADIAYAIDAIRLYEAMTPSTASEVRLRMDALGLTPKGKRDLRWRIASEKDAGGATLPQVADAGSSRLRARLSVVK